MKDDRNLVSTISLALCAGGMAIAATAWVVMGAIERSLQGPDNAKLTEAAFQGLYGAWVQGFAGVVAGMLAIGGGYLAYIGAIRAARINLEAAAKGVEAAQAKETAETAFQARTLAVSVIGEVTESLMSIQVDSLAEAVRRGSLDTLEVTVIQRPRFLDMDVRQVAVMGLDVVTARQEYAEQLDLTIKCSDAALSLIHRNADELQRIVLAAELVQIGTEARDLAFKLLVELHRLAGVDLSRQAKNSPEASRR